MKYLKLFEQVNNPEIGDYILCKSDLSGVPIFIKDEIGQIKDIVDGRTPGVKEIHVKYENVPKDMKKYFDGNNIIVLYIGEILDFSSNKEDLETILASQKYNI